MSNEKVIVKTMVADTVLFILVLRDMFNHNRLPFMCMFIWKHWT